MADTNDKPLGPGFSANHVAIHEFVQTLSKTIHMRLNFISKTGNAYSCKEITKAAQEVSAEPDDVVIFYNSGHGANDPSARLFFHHWTAITQPVVCFRLKMYLRFSRIKESG